VYLMEHVRNLENRDNRARGQQVLAALRVLGIEPVVQERRWPRIRNIIVDFSPNSRAKRLLFSAHYDAAKGSPGANDNASGVAVLLGLCQKLRHLQPPIRLVFFDREEASSRVPHLGLLGSFYYVWQNNLKNIAAVYNLEFCGLGDCLGIWPVRAGQAKLAAVKEVEKAAIRRGIPFQPVDIPWPLLTSDHLPFRLKGVNNSITLSLLPAGQVPMLKKQLAAISIPRLLIGRRPALPEPFSVIHTDKDTSSRLSEDSLRLMLSLLLELIKSSSPSGS